MVALEETKFEIKEGEPVVTPFQRPFEVRLPSGKIAYAEVSPLGVVRGTPENPREGLPSQSA